MDKFDDYLEEKSKSENEKFVLPKSFDNKIEETLENLNDINVEKQNRWYENKKVWTMVACFAFVCFAGFRLSQNSSLNELTDNSMLRSASFDKDSQKESAYDFEIQSYSLEDSSEFEITLKDIPNLEIIAGDNSSIDAENGYYNWTKGNKSVCADTAGPPDLIKNTVPLILNPGEEIKLRFSENCNSYKVNLWQGNFDEEIDYNDIKVSEYISKNFKLKVPSEIGVYTFEVIGKWESGEASYAFKVEVK